MSRPPSISIGEGANGGSAPSSILATNSNNADDGKPQPDPNSMLKQNQNHNQQDKNEMNGNTRERMDPARQKVETIISHRRMLLERMKICRKATENRLELYAKGGIHNFNRDTTANETAASVAKRSRAEIMVSSRKKKFVSKQIELQSYKDLCEYAMAHTVKKQVTKANIPAPRGSISLRTGSSVGNKMKAAVATLTSNAGWVKSDTTTNSSSTTTNKNTNIKSNNHQDNRKLNAASSGAIMSSVNKVVAKSVTSGGVSLHTTIPKKSSIAGPTNLPLHKQAIPPANGVGAPIAIAPPSSSEVKSIQRSSISTSSASASAPPPNQTIKKENNATSNASGKQLKKKSNPSGKKRSGKAARAGNTMSTSEIPPAAKMPLHHGIMHDKRGKGKNIGGINISSKGGLPTNYPSRKVCPEAEHLRKKRRDLIASLDNVISKRIGNAKSKPESDIISGRQIRGSRSSKLIPQTDGNPYSKCKKPSWKNFMTADSAAVLFPQRRKTQWDYVLEEMRWLATDFVEESKWKRASAKTLSAAILTHQKETVLKSPPTTSKQSTIPIILQKKEKDEIMMDTETSELQKETASESESTGGEASESDSAGERNIRCIDFVDPSEDDIKHARSVSKKVNGAIEDIWELNSSSLGILPNKTRSIAVRHMKSLKVKAEEINGSTSLDKNDAEIPSQSIARDLNQLGYEEIERRIQCYRRDIEDIKASLTESFAEFHTEMSTSLETIDMELQQNQMEMLQFTEEIWNNADGDACTEINTISGAVIDGPLASGKTFSTGVLLWRRKEKGPQLLLCPGASLIRWRHELRRFTGLNIVTIGPDGSFDDEGINDEYELKSGDMILCELSLVKQFINRYHGNKFLFSTVIVDARCSILSKIEAQRMTTPTKRKVGSTEDLFPYSKTIANELYSGEWWNIIIENLLGNTTKCALLEVSGAFEGHHYSLVGDDSKFSQKKEKADILSFKVAFLFHKIFQSNKRSYGRRAFWWTKKFYKKLAAGNEETWVSLSNGVKGILTQVLDIVTYPPDFGDEGARDLVLSSIPKWNIQTCELSRSQRAAYDRTCAFVRGSVICAKEVDASLSCAKALIRLRRVCFHSDLHCVVDSARKGDRASIMENLHSHPTKGKIQNRNNSSQPNTSFARSLIEESSKLRQLLNILSKECGYDIPSKHFLLGTKATRVGRKRSIKHRRKKVLILATLPEVLLLISSFLNAIGIAHDLLSPPGSLPGSNLLDDKSQSSQNVDCVLSWIHNQQSIAKFESSISDQDPPGLTVLVCSPSALGSTSFGLSASNAEIVISVDEDWSGRSDLQMYTLLRKNRTRNMLKLTGRKYIKLVAEETCEESFLTYEKKGRGKKSIHAYPIMTSLLKNSSLDASGRLNFSTKAILGKNMIRFTNVPLHLAFCSNAFPLGAISGTPPLFLSGLGKTTTTSIKDDKDESDLSKVGGDKGPLLFDDQDEEPEYIETIGGRHTAHTFGISLARMESLESLPSLPSSQNILHINNDVLWNNSKLASTSCLPAYHDLCSNQIQRYMLLSTRKGSVHYGLKPESDESVAIFKKAKIPGESVQSKKSEKRSKSKKESSDFTEPSKPLQVGVPSSKPEDIAASLILYSCDNVEKEEASENNAEENDPSFKKRRTNAFVRSYSSIRRKCDGNQGCEGLIYFPPLFPGLLQTGHYNDDALVPIELPVYNSGANVVKPPLFSQGKKRKSTSEGKSAKKSRINPQVVPPAPEFSMGISPTQIYPTSHSQTQPLLPANDNDLSMVDMTDADFMDSTMDLFDGGDILPDLTITKDEDIDTTVQNDSVADTTSTKPSLNEDFGLLGSGFLPPLEDSFRSATSSHGHKNSYSYWLDPFEPTLLGHDSDDLDDIMLSSGNLNTGPRLDSVILLVKKANNSMVNSLHRPPQVGSFSLPLVPGSCGSGPNGYFDQKKKKKGGGLNEKRVSISNLGPLNALGPVPIGAPSSIALVTKDVKPRNHANFSSVIEAFAHRGFPSVLLQHNVENILDSGRNDDFDQGQTPWGIFYPRKQTSVASPQCSIRELIPNESTGDSAKKTADTQKELFCRDTLVSSDVDFGPFSVSVFPDSTVKEKGLPSSTRFGIRLPMGVKIPKSIDIYGKNKDLWSKHDDDRLKMYAKNFGFNWHTVSQALTRKSSYSACVDAATIKNQIRSAKQCKERWKAFHSNEDINEEKGDIAMDLDKSFDHGTLVVDPRLLAEAKKVGHASSVDGLSQTLSRIRRLKKASMKKQDIKLTIPGYTGGPHMPALQIVPSHPSHSQSVQAAIAKSAGPSGIVPPRAEMWPLQFLDLTEKQNQQVKKLKQSNVSQSRAPQQPLSTSRQQQQQRQNPVPSRAPPHTPVSRSMPPNVQGVQPQMMSHQQGMPMAGSSQQTMNPGHSVSGKGPTGTR